MANVAAYPGQIIAINGGIKGPFPPGPASSFRYDVDVVMGDGVRRFVDCNVHCQRWPDTFDCDPLAISSWVWCFKIGETVYIAGPAEMPVVKDCE